MPAGTFEAIPVYVESSRTRTFACAYDWPGWCRSGKDEASALAALAAYAPRYAAVAKQARVAFDAKPTFRVVERLAGSASTEFGVPAEVARSNDEPNRIFRAMDDITESPIKLDYPEESASKAGLLSIID